MKNTSTKTRLTFKLTIILFATILFSTKNLANLKLEDKIDNIEGYPYNLLIQRTDQVQVIYKGGKQISCRVDIRLGEQLWSGETQVVKAQKFKQSPLKYCLDRAYAKQILATTF
ncbi:hypothetical protein [Paraglaciecola sp.]|uniref:hypothetical protein n=1 Tax=Paraglaciecola sp. TaxID=1920173 RepID=UPI0030F388C5